MLPFIISNKFFDRFFSSLGDDSSMIGIRILSRRMVSPDDDVLHITDMDVQSLCNPTKSSVMIKPCEACDVLCWNGRREFF